MLRGRSLGHAVKVGNGSTVIFTPFEFAGHPTLLSVEIAVRRKNVVVVKTGASYTSLVAPEIAFT